MPELLRQQHEAMAVHEGPPGCALSGKQKRHEPYLTAVALEDILKQEHVAIAPGCNRLPGGSRSMRQSAA